MEYDALQHRHTNPFHLQMYLQPTHPRQFKCNIQPILPSPVFGEFHSVSDALAETVWNCADAQQLVFSISALLSQTHPEKYYSHLGFWSLFTLNQCVLQAPHTPDAFATLHSINPAQMSKPLSTYKSRSNEVMAKRYKSIFLKPTSPTCCHSPPESYKWASRRHRPSVRNTSVQTETHNTFDVLLYR